MDFKGIKNLIVNSKVLGKGSYGYVLLRDDKAYKIDRIIYENFQKEDMKEASLKEMLKYSRLGFLKLPDENLMNYYNSIRDNVRYTKLPSGILYYEDTPLLLEMPYHKDYVTLSLAFLMDDEIYRVLFNLSKAFQELIRNKVYQMDLCYGNNIMVNELTRDVQLIDLDGEYIKYGDDTYAKKQAYSEFFNVVYLWLRDLDVRVDTNYFQGRNIQDVKNMLYHTSQVLKKEGKFYSK